MASADGFGQHPQNRPVFGWYPAEHMTTIFIMQRAHAGDQRPPRSHNLWTAVYQAIDD